MNDNKILADIIYNKVTTSKDKITLDFEVVTNLFKRDKLDKKQLEKELNNIIPSEEKDYIKLISFSKKTAKFEFDVNKWMSKSIRTTITDTSDKFEKRIKLNKFPIFINNYVNSIKYTNVIEQSFRTCIEKNPKFKEKIVNSIQGSSVKKLSMPFFNTTYDSFNNSILISLKPEFRINPLVYVSKEDIKVKKFDFDKYMKNKIKQL